MRIACSLGRDDLAARWTRWRSLLDSAQVERAETERGIRLSFRPEAAVFAELEALAALERDCCAFAAWTVRHDGERVVLEVSGGSALAVAAVRAMF
jgi:hypothetical protein